ncbi:FtsX-like permease family protein [Desmospora activa]|uniref:Putative ABC transport system permease protein n=1 Tax=Desmospora activa DSM 45169 TaxID=1121389 RepID=A0A2T4ZA07_9BACL|nr:ABC transporter permease [Desmospora activa]PTM58722.1 putative ABC transport system permease protein [Desmospora activa DSM 45169]
MNFRQFALNNVRRNGHSYIAYFLSSSFAVMALFTYLMFVFHPDIAQSEMGIMAKAGMTAAAYMTFFFSFLFVLYSISAFLKARMKEFGILTILGAARGQLNRLIFLENMLIGTVAVVTGVLSGLLFSKLFLLLGANVLDMKELPMYMPMKALGITVVAFIGLYTIISLFTTVLVRQSKAIEMLLGSKKPKKEPKASIWLALLSISAFASGLYLMKQGIDDEWTMLVILLLDIVGTYFFFTQLSVLIIRLLKKNRSFSWRGVNLLWVSEMAYKIKDNARMFFMVTMVTVIACTAAGIVWAIKIQSESAYKDSPFAFSYHLYEGDEADSASIKKLEHELKQAGVEVEKFAFQEIVVQAQNQEGFFTLLRQSDYEDLAKLLSLPRSSLQPGEALLIQSKLTDDELPQDLARMTLTTTTPQHSLQIKNQFTKSLFGMYHVMVVNDTTHDQIAKELPPDRPETRSLHYLVRDWPNDSLPAADSLEVTLSKQLYNWGIDQIKQGNSEGFLMARAESYMMMKQGTDVMLFVGLFIAMIFSVFIASFLYFKLFNDLQQDQRYYHGLSKIGLSPKEMKKAATIQIALLFYIPLFFAAIQAWIGLSAIEDQYHIGNMTMSVLMAIGIFTLVQTIYFLIVRSRYLAHLKRVMV